VSSGTAPTTLDRHIYDEAREHLRHNEAIRLAKEIVGQRRHRGIANAGEEAA
jgi:hypothetical protein